MYRDLAGTLSAFEVMWKDFYDLVIREGGHHAPLAPGHPFYVLIEALGSDSEADSDRFETALHSAQAEGLLADGVIAMSGKQREEIWAIRDGIGFIRLGPVFVFDVSLRISDMKDYVDQVVKSTKSAWPNARVIPLRTSRSRESAFYHRGGERCSRDPGSCRRDGLLSPGENRRVGIGRTRNRYGKERTSGPQP